MNLIGITTRDEARFLIAKELGRKIEDDGDRVILHTTDLSEIKASPSDDVMYAGVFDLNTFDALKAGIMKSSYMEDLAGDKVTIDNTPTAPPQRTGMLLFNYLDVVALGSDGLCQFSGYKFTLKKQWDLATLGSLTNGTGWSIVDGINVHSSGTTEAAYGYTFEAKKYRLTIIVSGVTDGSLLVKTDAVTIDTISADGTYVLEWDGDDTDTSIYLVPSTDFDGGYDTATIKLEVLNKY